MTYLFFWAGTLHWVLGSFAILWALLAGAAALHALKTDHARPWLAASCLLNVLLCALAAVLSRTHHIIFRFDSAIVLILSGWAVLVLQLVVRLFARRTFRTHVGNFDFGYKLKRSYSHRGKLELVPNIAFDWSESTMWHYAQGVAILCWFMPACTSSRAFFDCAGSLTALYPTYNTIKRVFNSEGPFSTSSFCNNAAEWATGFCHALFAAPIIAAVEADEHDVKRRFQQDLACQEWGWVRDVRLAAGGLLCFAALLTFCLLWRSWHHGWLLSHGQPPYQDVRQPLLGPRKELIGPWNTARCRDHDLLTRSAWLETSTHDYERANRLTYEGID